MTAGSVAEPDRIAETARLVIRPLSVADAAFVLELVNEPAFKTHIADKHIHTLDEAARFIREGAWTNQDRAGHGQFAMELKATGETVGICGLLYRDALAESDIGYAVLHRFRRLGLAHEAAAAVLRYGAGQLGLARVLAVTGERNKPSRNLLEKLGMRALSPADSLRAEAGTVLYEWRRP